MKIVICPGIHSPQLTQSFLAELALLQAEPWVFPADRLPAYSGLHILDYLRGQLRRTPPSKSQPASPALLWIGFSAGVVGAIAAARLWQKQGGQVKGLIAIDGWGVPLYGNFPIHRISHDAFTHWSSALLGQGYDSFYADPSVGHLDLWRSPHTVHGWWIRSPTNRLKIDRSGETIVPIRCTASQFLHMLLSVYGPEPP